MANAQTCQMACQIHINEQMGSRDVNIDKLADAHVRSLLASPSWEPLGDRTAPPICGGQEWSDWSRGGRVSWVQMLLCPCGVGLTVGASLVLVPDWEALLNTLLKELFSHSLPVS